MLTSVMLCHCNGVSDREVRAAVAGGAHTVDTVMRACGAGSDCGGCHVLVEQVVDEALVEIPRRRVLAPTAA